MMTMIFYLINLIYDIELSVRSNCISTRIRFIALVSFARVYHLFIDTIRQVLLSDAFGRL